MVKRGRTGARARDRAPGVCALPYRASHNPSYLASFVVSCGPGPRSEREFVGGIVRVVANVGCQEPWLVILAVTDGIACARHSHDDRAIFDRDQKLGQRGF